MFSDICNLWEFIKNLQKLLTEVLIRSDYQIRQFGQAGVALPEIH
jgi:hypothetical protein